MSIKEASVWASQYLGKNVTTSNISYLIQYGRIPKQGNNGSVVVNKLDLETYYKAHHKTQADSWRQQLGNELNWDLSFSRYKESETTKHVHRLHPYKGKFIPQLVEYFLDCHTDSFKKKSFFKKGDIILDPFCGSGTMLVQANELGLNAVGIDISAFNAFISNVKIGRYQVDDVRDTTLRITSRLKDFQKGKNNIDFEKKLLGELKTFNKEFFPSPEFKSKLRQEQINETQYSGQKVDEFLGIYNHLIDEYKIELEQNTTGSFIDYWFLGVVRAEIDFVLNEVNRIKNLATKKLLFLILSRTIRSCRATTHADLGTLKKPISTIYYCKKHGKICKPLFSILSWWQRYAQDTMKRIEQFNVLRSNTYQICLSGDSRKINMIDMLAEKAPQLSCLVKNQKIAGIFSSPPYVGLIDYHEQHAYAYDLFDFARNDELEIGPLCKGQGLQAQKAYTQGVADVLSNCKAYLQADFDIFLVANDKYGLYPHIAERSNMKIVNRYHRPVLNRVEKGSSAYSETIFHLQGK